MYLRVSWVLFPPPPSVSILSDLFIYFISFASCWETISNSDQVLGLFLVQCESVLCLLLGWCSGTDVTSGSVGGYDIVGLFLFGGGTAFWS